MGWDWTIPFPALPLLWSINMVTGEHALYHFDMYRVESYEDLYSTGFFDYLDYGGILAIEWSENIEAVLPPNTITVTIQRIENDPDLRRIQIDRP